MNPATVIVAYREALGRARNVVCDLEDFEWINRTQASAAEQLASIAEEAGRVASILQALALQSGKSEGT